MQACEHNAVSALFHSKEALVQVLAMNFQEFIILQL